MKVCITFPNTEEKLFLSFDPTVRVSEVKSSLLKHYWPESQPASSKIRGLRFFCMGRELNNQLCLSEIQSPDQDLPLPFLVQAQTDSTYTLELPNSQVYCCACSIF